MNKASLYLGPIGILAILAGAIGRSIAAFPFWWVVMAAGALAVLVHLALHRDRVRHFLGSRQARYGTGSAMAIVLVLGILVFVGILTAKHSKSWDLTQDQRYGLAPQTIKILENLPAEVHVTGFYQGGEDGLVGRPSRYLFEDYAKVSPKFTYEVLDFDQNPSRVREAGVNEYDVVVVRSGEKSEQIRNLSEERLTNAVVRMTKPGTKAVYFITGHGERDIDEIQVNGYSQAKGRLESLNYEVKPLLLMRAERVPEDAAVVVMAGPESDLLPQELEALGKYLVAGGKAMFMVDPMEAPKLAEFLAGFNVKLGLDIVIDGTSRLAGFEPYVPLTNNYTIHSALEGFQLPTLFPLARSVSVVEQPKDEFKTVELIRTVNEESWAETDLEKFRTDKQVKLDEGVDVSGPVSLAVAGRIPLGRDPAGPMVPTDQDKREKEGRFVAIGDSDFAANGNLNLLGNGDLFVALLSWLAEEEDLVAVGAKDRSSQPLFMNLIQASLFFWIPVVVLPLLVLVVGGFVWISRRRRG